MQGLTDKEITLDMLNSAKQSVTCYAKACNETANPNLRQILENQLKESQDTQRQIFMFAQQEGFYQVSQSPQQAISQSMQELTHTISGQQTHVGSFEQSQGFMQQQQQPTNPYHQ